MQEASPDGTIITVAGNGTPGESGRGGPAWRAQLNWPRDIAIAADGSLFIADTRNHSIAKVGPDGIISTVVGGGAPGYSGDGGPATRARLNGPRDVEIGPDGSLYIADTDNHCIRQVTPDGVITTLAGSGTSGYCGDGMSAANARVAYPQDVALGADGSLYFTDTGNHRIRQVTCEGTIRTVAGTGVWGHGGDGGAAVRSQLARPRGVCVDSEGCLYIADTENHSVRKVTPDGTITTVAGNGTEGYSGDGDDATCAQLAWPRGVVVDADGCLFIADCGNSLIRKVAPDGTISTVGGTGAEGYSGNGGPALRAQLADPHGIQLGVDGSLYIGEPRNHCIRRIWGLARAAQGGSENERDAHESA